MEVTFGGSPLGELVAALVGEGVRFNRYAEQLLPRVGVAPVARRVELVVTTVGELGFTEGATFDEVIAGASERGLASCPLELALWLRRTERVYAPRVTVLSARIDPDERFPRGFYLRDDAEGRWLRAFVASDDWVAPPDERVACMRNPSDEPGR